MCEGHDYDRQLVSCRRWSMNCDPCVGLARTFDRTRELSWSVCDCYFSWYSCPSAGASECSTLVCSVMNPEEADCNVSAALEGWFTFIYKRHA